VSLTPRSHPRLFRSASVLTAGAAGGRARGSHTLDAELREVLYALADLVAKTGFAVLAWAQLSRPRRTTAAHAPPLPPASPPEAHRE
jgi:hypothetical protein